MESTIADQHHLIDTIFTILPIFSIAGLVVPLLQRLNLSPVLGYLICGIFIGPYGLGLLAVSYPWIRYITITSHSTVHMLGELGIITLMFMIGLELSLDKLRQLRKFIFGLGALQIVISAVVIFLIAKWFENSLQASVLIGASFALSSTAIVMKLLEEHKLSGQPIAVLCFSILLMQDLAVIPILVLATSFQADSQANIFIALGSSFLIGIITVITIYWLGKKALAPLLKSVSISTTHEWLVSFITFIVLLFSIITFTAGMSLALGAFLVGLLISETEFSHEVEVMINPLKGLLMGIFFLSIGMMINIEEILRYPGLLSFSVIGILILKAIIIFCLCLAFRIPLRQATVTAIYLAEPGEFALMILGVAMATQLMPAHDVQFFLLITVLAMMLTPLLFKIAPLVGNWVHDRFAQNESQDLLLDSSVAHKVIIAGFGRVGQLIADILQELDIPYLALDTNAKKVQKLKKQGYQIIYGDARKQQLWNLLISDTIESAIIAIDDHSATRHILRSLRGRFPLLPVIIRANDINDLPSLYQQGANYVVAETRESSLRIAEILLGKLSNIPTDAYSVITCMRDGA